MRLLTIWLLTACVGLSIPYRALAQEQASASSVHGSVGVRGNYYWERSTRVVAPAVAASLVMPFGVRVEATYLLDAITSASQATGVQSDVGFTEIRNDIQGGVGYEVDFNGRAQLDLTATGRYSKEPDYISRGAGLTGSLNLFDRTTTLRLNGYFLDDKVFKVDRMAPPTEPNSLMATDPIRIGSFNALSLGLAADQVLTPTTVVTLGADLALLDGFQANVYRVAAFQDGGGRPEDHPGKRRREAYYLWFAEYFTETRSAFRFGYRLYRDSWDILAHAPEARVHQEIGRYAEMRLRYRYYTQTPSFFWREAGNLRRDRYATADPKMSRFHDQTVGLKVRLSLAFLSFTALDFAHGAVVDFGIEYIFNTNRFGNGVIGQGGLSWPF